MYFGCVFTVISVLASVGKASCVSIVVLFELSQVIVV